jgi:predicted Zn finger-like uncharacterized protein
MILVCPSCDTRYFAEDTAVGKEGRRVRCASCGHQWFAKPPEDGAAPAPEDAGLTREQVERLRQTAAANSASRTGPHSEFRAKEVARRKRNRTMAAWTGWGAGLVIVAGFVAGLVVFRDGVVQAWPQTASLYQTVGLKVNRFGLDIINVGAKRSFDGTTPVLTVTGQAVNHEREARSAPKLRVSLRDERGKEVGFWEDNLGVATIEPGQTVDFSTSKISPPQETYDLQVTFVLPAGEAAPPAETGGHGDIQDPAHPSAGSSEHPAEGDAHPPEAGHDAPEHGSGDGEEHAAPPPAEAEHH